MKVMEIKLEKPEGGAPGSRSIIVDGVRWGRTICRGHGCHGRSHSFYQEAGGPIYDGRSIVEVRTQKKPYSYMETALAAWQPTEQRVLDKARELIETGKLRHPDVIRAETKKAAYEYTQKCERIEAERKATFLLKACEAIKPIQDRLTLEQASDLAGRIAATMEWAQSQ
jgi:hypothetical protein